MSRLSICIALTMIFFRCPVYASGPVTGIICTMTMECDGLRARMTDQSFDDKAGRRFVTGKLSGRSVVIVKSPMGKIENTITALMLHIEYGADVLYSVGAAGGLSIDLHPGDVIVANSVVEHDPGRITSLGFIPYVKPAESNRLKLVSVVTSENKKREFRVFVGRIASGDQFIESTEESTRIRHQFEAHAVDTSSGAISAVCQRFKLHCFIVRTISDAANENSRRDFYKTISLPVSPAVTYVLREIAGD